MRSGGAVFPEFWNQADNDFKSKKPEGKVKQTSINVNVPTVFVL